MNQHVIGGYFLVWLTVASIIAFGMFGFDKWLAKGGSKSRISELSLLLISAVGGWPGGLTGLILFRHKSAKSSFLMKFFVAFIGFGLVVTGGLRLIGKI